MTQTRETKTSNKPAAKAGSAKGGKKDLSSKGRKKIKKVVTDGKAHVYASFNNTIVTITDRSGNAIAWASAPCLGYRGSRKSTPYAASEVAAKVATAAMEYGLKTVEVELKGPGAGRESAIRGLQQAGLQITSMKDVTPVAHNGCRPPKKRRV